MERSCQWHQKTISLRWLSKYYMIDAVGPWSLYAFTPVGGACQCYNDVITSKVRLIVTGELDAKKALFNVNSKAKERVTQMLRMLADDSEPIEKLAEGDIAVLVGLKHTKTGQTLRLNAKESSALPDIPIPPPVFVCSIEPYSAADESPLEQALFRLHMEDPSFRIHTDEESGQRIISGMGELHLEIILDRLINDLKVRCKRGPIWISYRETLKQAYQNQQLTWQHEGVANGRREQANLGLTVSRNPSENPSISNIINISDCQVRFHDGLETEKLTPGIDRETIKTTVKQALEASLSRGALLGFPLHGLDINVESIETQSSVSAATLHACSAALLHNAMKAETSHSTGTLVDAAQHAKESKCTLLEPIMSVRICVPAEYFGAVMSDFSNTRFGEISHVGNESDIDGREVTNQQGLVELASRLSMKDLKQMERDSEQTIEGLAPLSQLLGYSSALRSLTRGYGKMHMEFHGYREMAQERVAKTIQQIRGY
jgi:elongation factor G